MSYNTNRDKDSLVEREIAKFLDKNLYANDLLFSKSNRTDGKKEQIDGSDIVVSTADGKLDDAIVDEKVAARYANTDLNTFALELSFIGKQNNVHVGWFIDESKTTQYYLLGWITDADIPYNPKTKRYDTDLIREDNINSMDWVLVSRQAIVEFLNEKGYDHAMLSELSNSIRQRGYVKTKDFVNEVAMRYSDRYAEKPINILLTKDTYIKLSDYHGTITISKSK